jgi:hypothetical protein
MALTWHYAGTCNPALTILTEVGSMKCGHVHAPDGLDLNEQRTSRVETCDDQIAATICGAAPVLLPILAKQQQAHQCACSEGVLIQQDRHLVEISHWRSFFEAETRGYSVPRGTVSGDR